MNTENKNTILDALRLASGVIDQIAYVTIAGTIGTPTNITWSAASGGYLNLSASIDFTNTSGSDINIIGIALLSSNTTPTAGQPANNEAVAVSYFGSTIQVQDNEILRVSSATYTID